MSTALTHTLLQLPFDDDPFSLPLEWCRMILQNMQIVASQGARGQTILSLKGPLTSHTALTFQDAIRSNDSPTLIVDFSGVPFIDSAGLGALVGVHVAARKAGRRIAFAGMNDQARALMDMMHIDQLIHPYDTIEDAEAVFL